MRRHTLSKLFLLGSHARGLTRPLAEAIRGSGFRLVYPQ